MSPCVKWVLSNKAKIIVNEELHESVELTFKIWMEISSEKIRNYLYIIVKTEQLNGIIPRVR